MRTALIPPGTGRVVWVSGDHYTIKAHGSETGGALALVEAIVMPGAGPPLHRHGREDEAFYLLDGELEFQADGTTFIAGAGSWITLAKGSLHRFRNTADHPARMLILVTPAGLEDFFLEVGSPGRADEPAPFGPVEIERMLTAAPRYGLEILPPGDAEH